MSSCKVDKDHKIIYVYNDPEEHEDIRMKDFYSEELKRITFNTFEFDALVKGMFHTDPMAIQNVEFNPPLTIVIWKDGTKTFVKCGEGDIYDPEKGLAMAIAKKALGNKYKSLDIIDEWVEKKWSNKEAKNGDER